MYYDWIDINEGINPTKSNRKKNAWFTTTDFLIMDSDFNSLYGLFAMTILCLNLSDISIVTVKLIIVVLFITTSKNKK